MKLSKKRSRLDIRKHFFSQRIINQWNSLPANVVNAKTVNSFKNAYDRNYRNDMDIRSRWACRSTILQVQVLSCRLNNATAQSPVVCPSYVDNDGTVARGVSTSRCPIICPVVPSLFRPTDHSVPVLYNGMPLSPLKLPLAMEGSGPPI